ncbi:phage integrase [Calothrix sp. NIES-4071]|nr:phage integrase [Calothrix sp. NIES-4071]BAZ57935.1 phage integrase [Calothrix sp. NIES-4105]
MVKVNITPNNKSILVSFTFRGKRRRFNPIEDGAYGNSLDMAKAQVIAKQIEVDILESKFDETLDKYRVKRFEQSNESVNQSNNRSIKNVVNTVVNESLNLHDLFNRFYSDKVNELQYDSQKIYKNVLSKLEKCPYKTTTEAKQVINWLKDNYDGKNKNCLLAIIRQIKACCDWAVANDELPHNPFSNFKVIVGKIKPIKKNAKQRVFTVELRDSIISAFYNDKHSCYYASFVEFLFLTGCRWNEARAIQWRDINLDKRVITIKRSADSRNIVKEGTKQADMREFPINNKMAEFIKRIKPDGVNPNTLVFPSPRGKVIDHDNFTVRHWNKIAATVPGMESMTPYKTRHTTISLFVNEGNVAPVVVANWVGNSTQTIYNNYLGQTNSVSVPEI